MDRYGVLCRRATKLIEGGGGIMVTMSRNETIGGGHEGGIFFNSCAPILFPCVHNNVFYDISQVLNVFPITSHFKWQEIWF
jgi:hypothetical protein